MINPLITNAIALVTSVLLLIFSFFVIIQWKNRRISSVLLSAFLLSNSIYLFNFIIPTINELLEISLDWFSWKGYTFGYLFGPLIYLYTVSITNKNYKFSVKEIWHFLLFVIILIVVIAGVSIPWQLKHGLLNFQVFAYLIVCILIIRNYRNEIKEYFSFIDKINLTWLFFVVGGFFLMWFIDFINIIQVGYGIRSILSTDELDFLSIFINFVFAILIFYKTLQQPQFLFNITEEAKIRKYEGSKLSREEKERYLINIEDYFKNEKPFLNPSLTIRDISNATNIPLKYISQIINELLNKNFYDFINTYRIKEAMNQLVTNGGKDKTILEILYDSGFNSKTAFNTAFKKHTGLTPTEFRHQNITA